jgi:hypothetical protein
LEIEVAKKAAKKKIARKEYTPSDIKLLKMHSKALLGQDDLDDVRKGADRKAVDGDVGHGRPPSDIFPSVASRRDWVGRTWMKSSGDPGVRRWPERKT